MRIPMQWLLRSILGTEVEHIYIYNHTRVREAAGQHPSRLIERGSVDWRAESKSIVAREIKILRGARPDIVQGIVSIRSINGCLPIIFPSNLRDISFKVSVGITQG